MSKTIDFSTQLVIGGRPVPGVEGKTFDTINPANGKVLASIAEANSEDVNNAVSAARKAFEQGPWSKMAPADRKKVLLKTIIFSLGFSFVFISLGMAASFIGNALIFFGKGNFFEKTILPPSSLEDMIIVLQKISFFLSKL